MIKRLGGAQKINSLAVAIKKQAVKAQGEIERLARYIDKCLQRFNHIIGLFHKTFIGFIVRSQLVKRPYDRGERPVERVPAPKRLPHLAPELRKGLPRQRR